MAILASHSLLTLPHAAAVLSVAPAPATAKPSSARIAAAAAAGRASAAGGLQRGASGGQGVHRRLSIAGMRMRAVRGGDGDTPQTQQAAQAAARRSSVGASQRSVQLGFSNLRSLLEQRPNKARSQEALAQLQSLEQEALQAIAMAVVEAETHAAEKARVQMQLKMQLKIHATDKTLLEMQLKALVVDYLSVSGMLHARGLMEFAEAQLLFPLDIKTALAGIDRRSKWASLGRRDPSLLASILAANPSWTADCIPDKAVQLYSHLLEQPCPDVPVWGSWSKVVLLEGHLSAEQMRFLECLAHEVHCPCELRYRQLPPATTGQGL